MNMTDKESGQNIQFLILPSILSVVDKGTSLHCYYVKMCRTGEYACDTCSTGSAGVLHSSGTINMIRNWPSLGKVASTVHRKMYKGLHEYVA